MTKRAHIERIEAELEELEGRRGRLENFIGGGWDDLHLSAREQELLRSQHEVMKHYAEILAERLQLAGDGTA